MTKKRKIFLISLMLVIVLLGCAVLIYYYGQSHPYYDSIKKQEFNIPGLETHFVPQGFSYDEESQSYFISGYMSNGEASRVYYFTKDNDTFPKFVTLMVNGEEHKGHFGGVAVSENYVYLASDGFVYRVLKNDILSATEDIKVFAVDYFESGNGADSVTIHNNLLWVGEFYTKDKYETDESHHIEITETETNHALALGFELDENSTYGVVSTTPTYGISLPNQAQGFDFANDGTIVVSTSYSIPNSHILIYDNAIKTENIVNIQLFEKSLPVYVLSNEILTKNIEAPSMAEEIVIQNDRILILYESACKKWKLVNRTRVEDVYSIPLNY